MANEERCVCITFDHISRPTQLGDVTFARPHDVEERLRVGYPRVLGLLERYGIDATFFVEGWNGVHNTERVRDLVERGHEVGLHGWVHERWSTLGVTETSRLISRGVRALRGAGAEPVGFRAPGGARGPHTAALLSQAGLLYDASVGDDRTVTVLDEGIVHVPYRWAEVDGNRYETQPPPTPGDLTAIWQSALDEGAPETDPFVFVFHAEVSGADDQRVGVLEAIAERVVRDPQLRSCTVREVAEKARRR